MGRVQPQPHNHNTWLWNHVAAALPSQHTTLNCGATMCWNFCHIGCFSLHREKCPLFYSLRYRLKCAGAGKETCAYTDTYKHVQIYSIGQPFSTQYIWSMCTFCFDMSKLSYESIQQQVYRRIQCGCGNTLHCWDSELKPFIHYLWTTSRQHGSTKAEVTTTASRNDMCVHIMFFPIIILDQELF